MEMAQAWNEESLEFAACKSSGGGGGRNLVLTTANRLNHTPDFLPCNRNQRNFTVFY